MALSGDLLITWNIEVRGVQILGVQVECHSKCTTTSVVETQGAVGLRFDEMVESNFG